MLLFSPARRRLAALLLPAAGLPAACLPAASVPAAAQAQVAPSVTLDEVSVVGDGTGRPTGRTGFGVAALPGSAASVIENPVGQIVTAVGRDSTIANRPATNIGSVLLDSPGVTVRQGNGARDVIISVRGNNARSTGVTRNMVVLEDGFVLTQPDGFSRFDLVDPRAYSRIDVFRGPQSALFGNYATGGALAFRTRTGREISDGKILGYEVGVDAGSFGYLSHYFTVGGVSGPVEISLFASDVRANGYQDHSSYDTQTVNLLASYTPTPDNRFTLKVINNELHADIAARASLNQYRINPYQRGCASSATAASGCTTYSFFRNGAFGATSPVTATEVGLERKDRRTIVAARWEHDIDAQTTWRTQVGFDERNINQAFFTSSGRGSVPSYNAMSDITHRSELFGLPAVSYAALSFSALDSHATTFNLTPFAGPTLGALIGDQFAVQSNLGGRARTEVALSDTWTGVVGISAENTWITGRNLAYAYSAAGRTTSPALADRSFLNVAPELALVYRPSAEWAFRGRAATGYTAPAAGSLFVTPAGVPGNNTQLQTQQNLGFDLGADWTPWEGLRFSLTGFYEFFRNELVSQSPGAGLLAYTFNAPASEHRGIEVAADWAFSPGWRATLAYTFDDQFYTRYVEQLSGGSFTARFDRAGKLIPGVPAHQLLARLGYEQVGGPLSGLGGFVEVVAQDDFFVDNANLLKAPGYALVNANVHYVTDLTGGYARRLNLYVEARNLLDRTYASSVQNLANSLNAGTGGLNGAGVLAGITGSVYAGAPRTVVAGMKLSF
ncbi:TonB-dependent receptor family protein [Methylobacterium sp. Leaf112]|uniref:TonB-dependent receptor family protein n=1 Tax=Methylobacterium sp. Leaf112 TaxID=1736258 RepID=UPI0009E72D63|nr:TonB-dependent receptor [Methylobacterium sp. Leaf112]